MTKTSKTNANPLRDLLLISAITILFFIIGYALSNLLLGTDSNVLPFGSEAAPIWIGILSSVIGLFALRNLFVNKSMNMSAFPNTHLGFLRMQFDPSLPPFINSAGFAQIAASGITFSILCPCRDNPNKLCPCSSHFNLYDPTNDGENVTFKNGHTGATVTINPTIESNLQKYVVDFNDFKGGSDNTVIIKITKAGEEITISE